MRPPRWSGRLPSRVTVGEDEALDSYLERLACANDLTSARLMRLIITQDENAAPSSAFFMIKPDPAIVERIADIGAVPTPSLFNATLMRFGNGLPLVLDRLDPLQRHSFRGVVAQGWFPRLGSQVCPTCLAGDGVWRIQWRLPLVFVCLRHGNFLITTCSGCAMPFRSRRNSPLRERLNPGEPCSNPMGRRNPCHQSILSHPTTTAPPQVMATARTISGAMSGQTIHMLGSPVRPQTYLAELRNLASLLLHLLSRPQANNLADWAIELDVEARSRTTPLRGPRWAISAPRSSVTRGHALAEAHGMLNHPNIDDASVRLRPWLDLLADERNGLRGWLLNRTARTPTIEHLVDAALANRHHVGRRLDGFRDHGTLPTEAIPQLMDVDVYRKYFAAMLTGYESTGRLYASLCMARSVTSSSSWSHTAAHLGLSPLIAEHAARAASNRMHVTPIEFADAVRRARHSLDPERDFRRLEARVRHLAAEPAEWFEVWRTAQSPARRLGTLGYAVTWMWCHVAQALLDVSPAWTSPPRGATKNAYRAFSERLPAAAQAGLRSLVDDDT